MSAALAILSRCHRVSFCASDVTSAIVTWTIFRGSRQLCSACHRYRDMVVGGFDQLSGAWSRKSSTASGPIQILRAYESRKASWFDVAGY